MLDFTTFPSFIIERMLSTSTDAREVSVIILSVNEEYPLYLVEDFKSIVVLNAIIATLRVELSKLRSVTIVFAKLIMFLFNNTLSELILILERKTRIRTSL